MNQSLVAALCQVNSTVGDLDGNVRRILDSVEEAFGRGAAVAILPEMALTGYPPEDLLLSHSFRAAATDALERLALKVNGGVALVGTIEVEGENLHNSVAIVADGRVHGFARKVRLPNYGVFDEKRYFEPARTGTIVEVDGVGIGVSICEDSWASGGPCAEAARSGARVLVNCSASPYHRGKGDERLAMLRDRAAEHGLPVAWCGSVGGQDELVFDGQSMVIDGDGSVIARARQFDEEVLIVGIPLGPASSSGQDLLEPIARISTGRTQSFDGTPSVSDELAPAAEVEAALQLGLRDYVNKNGFEGVVIGISGGIDSAVTATLAVDALGSSAVTGVVMPSPWSSTETQADARELCSNLGIECIELPIAEAMDAFDRILADVPEGPGHSLSQENIQARIRGNLLMNLSNRFGWLVVTTGNKSELAVGYSTLYGDAAGGFGLLKDVPKGLVYELADLRNSRADSPIPQQIVTRAPSAELRPGQRDDDSLPPYPVLDEILRLYVEDRLDSAEIESRGHERRTVEWVLALVDRAEYKRRQYPPGVKISPLAFGRDRRMPMTNRWSP